MSENRIHRALIVAIVLPILAGCSSTHLATPKPQPAPAKIMGGVALPQIHENAIPSTGSVVEYWPDGTRKSERIYKAGKMISAVYYASNGTRVYEMAEAGGGN